MTLRPRWLVAVPVVAAAASSAAPAQAPPVFRSEVESVYVDVFVSRGGQSVSGLVASSFELKDNGVRQSVELVAAESRPVRAVLVFDTSSSMAGERLAALKAAGEAFLEGLRPADWATALLSPAPQLIQQEPPQPALHLGGHLHVPRAASQLDGLPVGLEICPAGRAVAQVALELGEKLGAQALLEEVGEHANRVLAVHRAPRLMRGSSAASALPAAPCGRGAGAT